MSSSEHKTYAVTHTYSIDIERYLRHQIVITIKQI